MDPAVDSDATNEYTAQNDEGAPKDPFRAPEYGPGPNDCDKR